MGHRRPTALFYLTLSSAAFTAPGWNAAETPPADTYVFAAPTSSALTIEPRAIETPRLLVADEWEGGEIPGLSPPQAVDTEVVVRASPALEQPETPMTVSLRLSGAAHEGGPEFVFYADGEEIGRGTVDIADEEEPEEFTRQTLEDLAQEFEFTLPAGADPETLEVAMVNDIWGGPDRVGADRDLFVLSAEINGQTYGPSLFESTEANPNVSIENGVVSILTNGEVRLQRPQTGW